MTLLMTRIQVEDYDAWKPVFDEGRETIRAQAKGHRVCRSVEDPNEVFIAVEFGSPDDAREAVSRLKGSGALDRVTVKSGPAIVEEAESLTY
ncbi:MAG TPA: hypothetical protein VHF58_10510 [Solirubrobacterales bacterium]|nr:hypothetical protein [Solirubrobacterales bacterium]